MLINPLHHPSDKLIDALMRLLVRLNPPLPSLSTTFDSKRSCAISWNRNEHTLKITIHDDYTYEWTYEHQYSKELDDSDQNLLVDGPPSAALKGYIKAVCAGGILSPQNKILNVDELDEIDRAEFQMWMERFLASAQKTSLFNLWNTTPGGF